MYGELVTATPRMPAYRGPVSVPVPSVSCLTHLLSIQTPFQVAASSAVPDSSVPRLRTPSSSAPPATCAPIANWYDGPADQVVREREGHVVVQHQPVPLAAREPHRRVRGRAVALGQQGAHLVAPHPPRHRQRVGVQHSDCQVGPADAEVDVQQRSQPVGGQEKLPVAEEELPLGHRQAAPADHHRIHSHRHPDGVSAWLEPRLQHSLGRERVLDLGQVEERPQRHQRLVAVAVGQDRPAHHAPDLQVHEHRLHRRGDGVGDGLGDDWRGSGAGGRWGGGGVGGRRCGGRRRLGGRGSGGGLRRHGPRLARRIRRRRAQCDAGTQRSPRGAARGKHVWLDGGGRGPRGGAGAPGRLLRRRRHRSRGVRSGVERVTVGGVGPASLSKKDAT